jgi:hypothetical protein
MSILKIHWNFVKCVKATNLKGFAKASTRSFNPNVEPNCRGVYFRSVLSEDLDFSDVLAGMKFEEVRRARNEPDNSLLYRPKCKGEQSIGVLRIMKPRKFNTTSAMNAATAKVNTVSRGRDFDVLLESTEFILEEAQEQMQERYQIQETFGDFNVFFFGKRAEIFQYSGSLLNGGSNLQWRNQFLDNYERYLRGTKCAELKARAYFLYDDVIREGFILGASTGQSSVTDGVVKFTFQMLITSKRIMGFIPDSRAGSLTLDRSGDTQQGVTDYQFTRSIDADLVSVSNKFEIGENGEAIPLDSSNFVTDLSIPGTEPPADLKQLMINQSLDALEEFKRQGNVDVAEQSIDHDILITFVHESELGPGTQLAASGAKSLDIENFNGDQLVLLLISGDLLLSDLRLKQAAAVAGSFAAKNAPRIDSEVAGKLSVLGSYFSANFADRISKPTTPTTQYTPLFVEGKENYILQASRNDSFLDALITDVAPIATLNVDSLTAIAVDSVKVSATAQFLQKDTEQVILAAKIMETYVAAVALLRDPVTLNPFPAFTGLQGSVAASGNSIDYVRSQSFAKFAATAKALPAQFAASLEAAISNFTASTLASLISANIPGIALKKIPISEWTLSESTRGDVPRTSDESAKFLLQTSVLITGIVAERNKDFTSTSFDVTGGTVHLVKDEDAAKGAYFTSAYADTLKPGSSPVEVALFANIRSLGLSFPAFSDPSGGDVWILLPAGSLYGQEVLLKPHGRIKTVFDGQLDMLSAGYIRIPEESFDLFNSSDVSFLAEGRIRKPIMSPFPGTPDVPINTTGFTLGGFGSPGPIKLVKQQVISSVTKLLKYPASRDYIGSDPKNKKKAREYVPPTLDNLVEIATRKVGAFVESSSKSVADAMAKATKGFVTNGIPGDIEEGPIKAELAIDKLSSSPEIALLSTKLASLGATVGNFLDLLFVALKEQKMAKSLSELKDLLAKAVQQAQTSGGKGAVVADSDAATKKAICHA